MPDSSLRPGLVHAGTLVVTADLTVPRLAVHFPEFAPLPPVLATAMLVGFVEATCVACLDGRLAEGESTVGTHVDLSHVAPTPVGGQVRVEVQLVSVDGLALEFRVRATDDGGLVGEGHHRRAVIDLGRFARKALARGK